MSKFIQLSDLEVQLEWGISDNKKMGLSIIMVECAVIILEEQGSNSLVAKEVGDWVEQTWC